MPAVPKGIRCSIAEARTQNPRQESGGRRLCNTIVRHPRRESECPLLVVPDERR